MEDDSRRLYATQFHPEVTHTIEGMKVLSAFVYGPCGCKGDWKMDDFVEHTIQEIRSKVGDGKALCALSGGVDSSVAAVLMYADGKLTGDVIEAIMLEEKPNQKERIVLRGDRFKDLFPKELPVSKREDYVAAAMEHYARYLERKDRGNER